MKLTEFLPKWVAALRSEKYKPTTGLMVTYIASQPHFCAMGVACMELGFDRHDIEGKKHITSTMAKMVDVPIELVGDFRTNPLVRTITSLNDKQQYSHKQMANFIEDNLMINIAD